MGAWHHEIQKVTGQRSAPLLKKNTIDILQAGLRTMPEPVPPPSPSWPGMAEMSQRAPNKRMEGSEGMEGCGGCEGEQEHCSLDGERGIVKETDSFCGRGGRRTGKGETFSGFLNRRPLFFVVTGDPWPGFTETEPTLTKRLNVCVCGGAEQKSHPPTHHVTCINTTPEINSCLFTSCSSKSGFLTVPLRKNLVSHHILKKHTKVCMCLDPGE